MEQEVFIQVRVKVQTPRGEYNDALYFTDVEYPSISQKFIENEINNRVSNWIDSIENPPIQAEPTKEELIEQKAQLEAQVAELDAQIAVKNGK